MASVHNKNMKLEVKQLLKRILEATVCDWDKENFEESKVKRNANGQFAHTSSSKSYEEIETENGWYVNDICNKINDQFRNALYLKHTIVSEGIGQNRYKNTLMAKADSEIAAKIADMANEFNNDEYAVRTVPKDKKSNYLNIEIYNKHLLARYIDDISSDIINDKIGGVSKIVKGNIESIKQLSDGEELLNKQNSLETQLLKEIQNGEQTQHLIFNIENNALPPLHFDEYIKTLKDKGITDKELAMTYFYTAEPSVIRQGGSDPDSINEIERKTFMEMADCVEKFIEKAPKWKGGTMYRGCHFEKEVLDKILNQDTIDMLGVSSWTTCERGAQYFSESDNSHSDQTSVIFRLQKTNQGTSIASFSEFTYEEEVLISKKARFKKTKVSKHADGYIYIDLEEIK